MTKTTIEMKNISKGFKLNEHIVRGSFFVSSDYAFDTIYWHYFAQ